VRGSYPGTAHSPFSCSTSFPFVGDAKALSSYGRGVLAGRAGASTTSGVGVGVDVGVYVDAATKRENSAPHPFGSRCRFEPPSSNAGAYDPQRSTSDVRAAPCRAAAPPALSGAAGDVLAKMLKVESRYTFDIHTSSV
jgi:hypothetical protein